jgi:hypothetical protein
VLASLCLTHLCCLWSVVSGDPLQKKSYEAVGGDRAREQKYPFEPHMWPLTFDPELSFASYRGVKGCYLSLEKQYRAISEEYHKVFAAHARR